MELFLITIAWILGIIMGLYFKIGIAFLLCIIFVIFILKNRNRYLKLLITKNYILIFIIFLLLSYFKILYLENDFENR